jgi:hypothetical protein
MSSVSFKKSNNSKEDYPWFSNDNVEQMEIVVYNLTEINVSKLTNKNNHPAKSIEFNTSSSCDKEQEFFFRAISTTNRKYLIFGFSLNSSKIKGCKENFENIPDKFFSGKNFNSDTLVLYNNLTKRIEKLFYNGSLNRTLEEHEIIYKIARIRKSPTIIFNRKPRCEDLIPIDCIFSEIGEKFCEFPRIKDKPVWRFLYADVEVSTELRGINTIT